MANLEDHFVADDDRELNGHHGDHDDIKRQRSLAYNNGVDAYSNMWSAAAASKWNSMIKEEPKSSGPGSVHSSLPEILSNNPSGPAAPPAPSSGGSPHQFTYGSPNPGPGFPDVVFTSSATTPSDLIYDSINMTQVQNYSPSLSSSLGKTAISHPLGTFGSVQVILLGWQLHLLPAINRAFVAAMKISPLAETNTVVASFVSVVDVALASSFAYSFVSLIFFNFN